MKTRAILILLTLALSLVTHAQVLIFASATAAPNGQPTGGAAINSDQFIGTRFELTSPTHVSAIGGQFYSPPGSNGQMFGAIIRLDSLSALPAGNPFNAQDLSDMKLSIVVNVDSSGSRDYVFPASVDLDAGFYGLIYGKGLFGASSAGVVGADGSQNLSPDYMVYGHISGASAWGDGGFPNARLTIYGPDVPEPVSSEYAASIIALLFAWRKLRRWFENWAK